MRKVWGKEDIKWLVENYSSLGLIKCCDELKRSQSSILHKACNLGLKRRGDGRQDRYYLYDGYVYVSSVNDRYALHRRIIEDNIGRKLNSDEVVHHINHDRLDNRLENLLLTTRSEHQKVHHKKDLELRRDNINGRFK